MPRHIRTMNDVPLNPFEAVKRAFIKRGYLPRYFRRAALGYPTDTQAEKKKNQTDKKKYDDYMHPVKKSQSPEDEQDKASPKTANSDEDLFDLADQAQDVLYEASTIFPFALVPDTVKLDREKLTIARRLFWRTATITSTPVSEIMSCEASLGPIFGSLHFTFRYFVDNQRTISWFWREDAMQLQRLLHGYIIAHRKEIDTTTIKLPELKKLLLELGQGASD